MIVTRMLPTKRVGLPRRVAQFPAPSLADGCPGDDLASPPAQSRFLPRRVHEEVVSLFLCL